MATCSGPSSGDSWPCWSRSSRTTTSCRCALATAGRQPSIGLNYLTSDDGLWFTLADVLVAKLTTGKHAAHPAGAALSPKGEQENLAAIDLMGKRDYRVDPYRDDLYRRLIELRSAAKRGRERRGRQATHNCAEQLDAEQQALKICANAVCYGIHVRVKRRQARKPATCPTGASTDKRGQPHAGHRGAGAVLPSPAGHTDDRSGPPACLGIAEHLADGEGIGWAFCDTDSFALARPEGMSDADFIERAERVRQWFEPLNPYEGAGELFKCEEQNFRLAGGKPTSQLAPLYCFAVSAKRYALFNLDRHHRPVLRKVSGHGLGHLLPPYGDEPRRRRSRHRVSPLADLGVGIRRWQHDLWYLIVLAALEGHPDQVAFAELPGFDAPAISQYAATTPELLSWFAAFNRGGPIGSRCGPSAF